MAAAAILNFIKMKTGTWSRKRGQYHHFAKRMRRPPFWMSSKCH